MIELELSGYGPKSEVEKMLILPKVDTSSLVQFLKDNLKPRNFDYNEDNYEIEYDYFLHCWCRAVSTGRNQYEQTATYFEEISDEFLRLLNKNNVIPAQMREAFKELGW